VIEELSASQGRCPLSQLVCSVEERKGISRNSLEQRPEKCQNRAIKTRGDGTVTKQPFQFNCLSVGGRGMWHTWYRI